MAYSKSPTTGHINSFSVANLQIVKIYKLDSPTVDTAGCFFELGPLDTQNDRLYTLMTDTSEQLKLWMDALEANGVQREAAQNINSEISAVGSGVKHTWH